MSESQTLKTLNPTWSPGDSSYQLHPLKFPQLYVILLILRTLHDLNILQYRNSKGIGNLGRCIIVSIHRHYNELVSPSKAKASEHSMSWLSQSRGCAPSSSGIVRMYVHMSYVYRYRYGYRYRCRYVGNLIQLPVSLM